ncbi:uncharacterized protein PV07_00920 [Cladophialophora immunda]|uniref:Major facilitator superfamily (MFS) profile domain-containing protein n=1 Tax=Cladophialophora immunda TaxID=569365 RepID=A0A0D2DEK8_9EURO|nr:uncharacterized protein PV07_00920 [Cladophialophora immunda]KIW34124.1 hypothetical protein PV07_00920 [Cladophialophora immunda]
MESLADQSLRLEKEKQEILVENAENIEHTLAAVLSNKQQRRLKFKVDLHVVTMISIILAVSVIDRINIGSAKVLGMDDDIEVSKGARYSVCLLIFFLGYFLAEIPSNMMLVKVGADDWLSFLTFGFGLCVMCMGFVPNWQILAFLRFVLGLLEGGIFPACLFLLSSWYRGTGSIADYRAFMPCRPWRQPLIEGAATMVIDLGSYFFISDFPDKAKVLKPHERQHVQDELREDMGNATTDTLTYACVVVPTYGLGFFTPTILTGLGYRGVQATLHSAPLYAAAVGMLLLSSYLGDKLKVRGPLTIIQDAMTLAGMLLVRPLYSSEVRYLGIFLAVMGVMGNQITILTFAQNNIVGSLKRLLFSALNIGGGAISGIIGNTIFRSQDAPFYAPGLYSVVTLQVLMIVLTFGSIAAFACKSRQADRENKIIHGIEGWRYTL